MIKYINSKFLIVLLLLISSFFLRTYQINLIPTIVTHDEVYYLNEARSIALTFSNLENNWRPYFLTPSHSLFAELPSTFVSLGVLIFGFKSVLGVKLAYILSGLLIPLLCALIAQRLVKEQLVFWFVLILGLFNPFLFQFSRMGYDSLLSIFFYLSGILFYFHVSSKWQTLSIPLFIIGFFQYQGMKVILLPIIFILFIFSFYEKNVSWFKFVELNRSKLFISISLVLFFVIFSIRLTSTSETRINDLVFFDQNKITLVTNNLLSETIDSPLKRVFINKFTTTINILSSNFFSSLNINFLFTNNDNLKNPFSVWRHGLFYYLDFFLILLGIIYLSHRENTYPLYFVLSLMIISFIPSVINSHDVWPMFRSAFFIPWGIILSGMGLAFVYHNWNKYLFGLIIILYVLLVIRFLFTYFYSYPVFSTQGIYFSERILAGYIKLVPSDKQVLVLADESRFKAEEILFHNAEVNNENIHEIQQNFAQNIFKWKNILVDTKCISQDDLSNKIVIADDSTQFCNLDTQATADAYIPSIYDGGKSFRIYNDVVCHMRNKAERFDRIKILDNLKLMDSRDIFCENFIVR